MQVIKYWPSFWYHKYTAWKEIVIQRLGRKHKGKLLCMTIPSNEWFFECLVKVMEIISEKIDNIINFSILDVSGDPGYTT